MDTHSIIKENRERSGEVSIPGRVVAPPSQMHALYPGEKGEQRGVKAGVRRSALILLVMQERWSEGGRRRREKKLGGEEKGGRPSSIIVTGKTVDTIDRSARGIRGEALCYPIRSIPRKVPRSWILDVGD